MHLTGLLSQRPDQQLTIVCSCTATPTEVKGVYFRETVGAEYAW
jgi:hypothetical protein